MHNPLTKSELIESLPRNQPHLATKDVELAVKGLLEKMSQELANIARTRQQSGSRIGDRLESH